MRTDKEMFDLFYRMAAADERIRVMTLEGSRVNPNITPDTWQDFDITFLVTETESFLSSDEWLTEFGKIILLQKPEAMQLFPPDFPDGWFSYLMLLDDGVKIDLTLIPVEQADKYYQFEPLVKILLDKDGTAPALPPASDDCFRTDRPSQAFITDCANEFYFVCTYIERAILRKELLFAQQKTEEILHCELRRMLRYLAGVRSCFPVNTGKLDRLLPEFLTQEEYGLLMKTYVLDSLSGAESALESAMRLFDAALKEVCAALGYADPGYHEPVQEYLRILRTLGEN